MGIFVPLMN